ncbi:MAG TPA: sulfurtransferase TusA family protein [Candidatus Lokiarchaeia archaeon]
MSINNVSKEVKNKVVKLDIKGKNCPMTFIYTKLKLEEMEKGEIIEVLLDFPPAVENIPESCKRQDLAELIKIEEIDHDKHIWLLTLKKT